MAIFLSDLMRNRGLQIRGCHSGSSDTITAKVRIPANTTLTDGDIIKLVRLPPSVSVTEVLFKCDDLDSGGSPALDMDLGIDQALTVPASAYNATTNPAVTDSIASGSADPDYFVNGLGGVQTGGVARYVLGQSGLDNEFTVNSAFGLTGYADVVIEVITTGNDTVGATDKYIEVQFTYTGVPQTATEEFTF